VTGSRYQVSLPTYETLIKQFDLGEVHPSLSRGPMWRSSDEQRTLNSNTREELHRRGLLRAGQLDPIFLGMLRILQTASVEYYTETMIDSQSMVFRAAQYRQQAVLAVSTVDELSLFPTRPESAVRDLLARLPPTPPARLQSLSCAAADYRLLRTGKTPPQNSSSSTDAKQLMRWFDEPRQNFGRLFTAVRDQWGARKQSPDIVQWADTPHGRILVHLDSKDWVSLSGAGPQDLADKLNQLRANLH
jgi:hypothetical protein